MVLIKLIAFLAQKLLHYQTTAKIAKKFNGPYVFRYQWFIKLLSCSILIRAFQNWPNELHRISGSENITFSYSFLCLQITAEISKIKKRTQSVPSCTFNVLLKYVNILV